MCQFSTMISALPEHQRSYQPRSNIFRNCSLGIPANASETGQQLTTLADDCTGFEFVLGEKGLPFVKAFASSKFPAQTERLAVGDCSYNCHYDRRDLRPLVSALSDIEFPFLKQLYLGDYFQFVNGPGATGWLGDVTSLLIHSPAVQDLSLVGNFSLTNSVILTELTELTVEIDDSQSNLNRGPISNETLDFLLSSSFSKLEYLYLDLSIDVAIEYELPDTFLQGINLPSLRKMEIVGRYREGEVDKLVTSPLCQRNGFKLLLEVDE